MINLKKKIFRSVSSVAVIASLLFANSYIVFADNGGLKAYGQDTISGFSTTLHSTPSTPGGSVIFKVDKPDGTSFETVSIASYDGTASFELSDYHTRRAGVYSVYARTSSNLNYGEASAFTVLPGEVSVSASEVSPLEQTVKIGQKSGRVTATLTDIYGNSISNHVVSLISSRTEDSISAPQVSDSAGKAEFEVSSMSKGTSVYTVYDVTVNKVLEKKAKIVYFDSATNLFGAYGQANVIASALGNSSGPALYLGFDEVQGNIYVGQPTTLTLSAYDASGQVVTNYEGTINFSVVDGLPSSAKVPVDYTYIPQDLGAHTFTLGFTFNTSGKLTIKASDKTQPAIYGTLQVEVSTSNTNQNDSIELSNPVAGSYSNNIQIVSGTTDPSSKVVIYDNGAQIGTAVSSLTGEFVFTTGSLPDGSHDMYAAKINDSGEILSSSKNVIINIDTNVPEVTKFETLPSSTLAPGAEATVNVYSEKELSQAKVEVDGIPYELVDSTQNGVYSAKFKVPNKSGILPLVITLTDKLGNEFKDSSKYSIVVSGGGGVIGVVTSLKAKASDHKITLNWTAPLNGSNVKFYRIYYGLSKDKLSMVTDTFDAKTSWYIPNLKNSVEYFFAVVPVDNTGNPGTNLSNIVSSIPGSVSDPISPAVNNGAAGQGDVPYADKTTGTGPEIAWLLISALFSGIFYAFAPSRKNNL